MQDNGTPAKASTPSKTGKNKKEKRTPGKSPAKSPRQQTPKKQQKDQLKKKEKVQKKVKETPITPSPKAKASEKGSNKKKRNEKQKTKSGKKKQQDKKRKLEELKEEEEVRSDEEMAVDNELEVAEESSESDDEKLVSMLKTKGEEESSDDEDEEEDDDKLIEMLKAKDSSDDGKVAKKRKTETETEDKTKASAFAVDVHNVNASFGEQQIESALRNESLPFISVTKSKFNTAKIFVSSEKAVKTYLDKRTLRMHKSVLVFSVDKKEDDQIMIHNLSPEITKSVLMPYMKDIAEENGVTVEKMDIFPTQIIQGRAAAYVKFSGPVPRATEFHRAKIQGKPVDVMFVSEMDRKVLIRNLHKTITEDDLMEYAQEAGKVEYIYIITNEEGESMQRAVVCYKDMVGTREILDYSGADIQGKPVRIDLMRDEDIAKKARVREVRHGGRGKK